MSFASLLDSTVDIERADRTDDGKGGYTDTDAIIYRRVPCRFESASRNRDLAEYAYNKLSVYPDYFVYMEHRSGLEEGYQLRKDSRTFEIKLIENWSEQNKCLRLAIVEVGRGE